jgi:uncharacterized protein
MNKTTSIILLIVGMLLFLGSCAPFGYAIYNETVVESTQSYSLTELGASNSVSFNSEPNTLVRLALEAYVTTESVQEDPDDFSDEYLARFRFPVVYTASDSNGLTIISEDTAFSWKEGSYSKSDESVTSTEGSLSAKSRFDKFSVPADGVINVNIEVSPDQTYEAKATSLKLYLYEGMIDNTWYVVAGIALLVFGFIMALLGFIFVIVNATNANNESQASGKNVVSRTGQGGIDANQQAMFIQLAAFSGYIVPFGSIIVPIILWQVWKDNDPYVDRMGREGVNFQLTMALYYIICFLLFFILIGMVLIFFVMFFHLIFIIIGAVKTSQGIEYRYPMIIRFIKP